MRTVLVVSTTLVTLWSLSTPYTDFAWLLVLALLIFAGCLAAAELTKENDPL